MTTKTTHAEIWQTLSVIDVSEFVQSRGIGNRTLSWIPWSDCLALLQSQYPDFEYEFFPITLYPDGSAEVGCEVTICEVSRRIDLPVMDHKFNSVKAGPGSSPDSRAINDSRWRAFVKAVALHGLGFSLYRDGSGVPVPPVVPPITRIQDSEVLHDAIEALRQTIKTCESGGKVDSHYIALAKEVINKKIPSLDRVHAASAYLQDQLAAAKNI